MRAARLRRREDIARVRAHGIARNDRLFSLRALTTDLAAVRVAVAAVQRNRARRRVREALRIALAPRPAHTGADLLVIARPAALSAATKDLHDAVERELRLALAS